MTEDEKKRQIEEEMILLEHMYKFSLPLAEDGPAFGRILARQQNALDALKRGLRVAE